MLGRLCLYAYWFRRDENPEHGRLMAFIWVGIAYFLTAIIARIIIFKIKGGPVEFWNYPAKGWQWSLFAGT